MVEEQSWKQALDQKLNRLHSLLFGVEAAIDGQEWEKALGLGLCLLGFLESESRTSEDRVAIAPIKRLVRKQIDIAKEKHYQTFERNLMAAAGNGIFAGYQHRVDLSKIRSSRLYQPFISVDKTTQGGPTMMDVDTPAGASNTSSRFTFDVKERASEAQKKRERSFCEPITDTPAQPEKQKRMASSYLHRRPLHANSGVQQAENKNSTETQEKEAEKPIGFVTAKQKWAVESMKKQGSGAGTTNRTLGVNRRGVRNSFVPPVRPNGPTGYSNNEESDSTMKCLELLAGPDGELPDKLRNLEPRLLEHISNEIMEKDANVRWDDIAGLHHAKKSVTEMVIWPLLRPDIFHGCRSPGKGLLLFGPPGTGKTMIGKAIAGESKATFFSISASSLTSKWIGEGEKLVRALFGVASCRQPAVIFIDEVDSLLSQRKSEGEHESSRRIKTQFLIEMEGIGSGNEQLLLIGATNRPQELDEAARRRFTKRLYIPLPSPEARGWIVRNLLQKDGLLTLSENDIETICSMTEGYSGSDMNNLVKEASMYPLREALLAGSDIGKISPEEMRAISLKDFTSALQEVKPSVSKCELGAYEEWNSQFGSLCR